MKKLVLTLTILFLSLSYINPESTKPGITVRTDPEILITGQPFTLTFIIDHPAPEQVNIIIPHLTDALTLDRFVKYPRLTENDIQTVAEIRLTANNAGRIILNSFTIVTPAGIAETGAFSLTVRNPGSESVISVRFNWEGVPQRITTGERIILTLRASNWNNQEPLPSFFIPEAPQGVILSHQPLTAAERENGIAVRLLIIPLTPGNVSLPARVLQSGNIRFEIPALNILAAPRQ
jgi:hypothetical protein